MKIPKVGEWVKFVRYEPNTETTDKQKLKKGDEVQIVDYDLETKTIEVKKPGNDVTEWLYEGEYKHITKEPKKMKEKTKEVAKETKKVSKAQKTEEAPERKTVIKSSGKKMLSKTGIERERMSNLRKMQAVKLPDGSEMSYTPMLYEMVQNKKSKEVLQTAKVLNQRVSSNYFQFGGLLAHIYFNKVYEDAGYTGEKAFDRYLSEELDTKYNRAMKLINIYVHFTSLGVDEERFTKIGWTRALKMLNVAKPENVDDLITYAEAHTVDELDDHIQIEYKNLDETTGKKVKTVIRKFRLVESEDQILKNALDRSSSLSGANSTEQALINIATEWMIQNEGGEGVKLSDLIPVLESRYKVTLTAVKKSKEETKTQEGESDKKVSYKKNVKKVAKHSEAAPEAA